ncbi:MAG: hypothetical protein WBV94_28410 [Blastocatellia bacterium]
MKDKRKFLNGGSMSAAEIMSRLPIYGTTAESQSSEYAEVPPQGESTEKRNSSIEPVVQTIADNRSPFLNSGQARLAEARTELLDSAPLAIRKPLSLIEDHAYAVTWLYAKPHNSRSELRQLIVRDDGEVFGDGFEELKRSGLEVHLSETPKLEKLLSKSGFTGFLDGERPEAIDVFNRIIQIIDRFMDFNHSFADQKTMCEIIACYILATWFLDAFNVIGFMWSNGVRGSGKTQLLSVISELSYLNQTARALASTHVGRISPYHSEKIPVD